jgi:general stress protein 26
MPSQSTQDAIQTLAGLIHDIRVAMLTTVGGDGALHSRPMATQKTYFDGELWFLTSANSHKVEELRGSSAGSQESATASPGAVVNLSYNDPEQERYVSVSGRAEVVRDPAKVRELWRPFYLAWFPKGQDDPQIALIRVRVEEAEYWDPSHSSMVRIAGFLKAVVNGERPQTGEHRQISLEPGTKRTA